MRLYDKLQDPLWRCGAVAGAIGLLFGAALGWGAVSLLSGVILGAGGAFVILEGHLDLENPDRKTSRRSKKKS